jgi:hypothetical protein
MKFLFSLIQNQFIPRFFCRVMRLEMPFKISPGIPLFPFVLLISMEMVRYHVMNSIKYLKKSIFSANQIPITTIHRVNSIDFNRFDILFRFSLLEFERKKHCRSEIRWYSGIIRTEYDIKENPSFSNDESSISAMY